MGPPWDKEWTREGLIRKKLIDGKSIDRVEWMV